ncbi:hypothetical protein M0802_016768 [Mischocyttarus mexicanus]|nr:hypothetical protein M0802_016768 [Mischocyttarus mexicanus]
MGMGLRKRRKETTEKDKSLAVSSMLPIDNNNCVVVSDIKAVTHENAHVHDPISTQIPTEGKYRAAVNLHPLCMM